MSEDTANTHSDGGLSRRSLLTGSTFARRRCRGDRSAVAGGRAGAGAADAGSRLRRKPNILVIFGDDIGIRRSAPTRWA